jgi:hypothetical protein
MLVTARTIQRYPSLVSPAMEWRRGALASVIA